MKQMFALAAGTIVLFAGQGLNAVAADYHHLDNMALKLEQQTSELCTEVRLHYLRFSAGRHLLSDAMQLNSRAKHIHRVAHGGGSISHLANDIDTCDRLFHHMQELTRDIERNSWHGHHYCDTRHVRQCLGEIQVTLHHLRDDLARIVPGPCHGNCGHCDACRAHDPIHVQPGGSHWGHGHDRRTPSSGITFGRGPVRFSFRF